jgi:hypothetical protein
MRMPRNVTEFASLSLFNVMVSCVILVVGLKVGELSPQRSFAAKNSIKQAAHAIFELSLREVV